MSKKSVRLSDAEWTVMNALWERTPASARDVLESVQGETRWAYTTVCTILGRLAEKGVVGARKRKNTLYYAPRVTRDDARRSAVRSLVERAFGGAFAPMLQHLLPEESLSKADRERLAAMLAELEKRGGAP